MRLYTLRGLARETGLSTTTLAMWRRKGWLRPAAMAGTRARYTMDGFEEACRLSLPTLNEAEEAVTGGNAYRLIADRYATQKTA